METDVLLVEEVGKQNPATGNVKVNGS